MLGEMADISPATADGADEDLLAALLVVSTVEIGRSPESDESLRCV
jgi:hypothetical protein